MVKPVSKSEFARMCGVSPAAVTKACSTTLKDAVCGKRIDAGHKSAIAYQNAKSGQRRADKQEKKNPTPAKKNEPVKRGRAASNETKKAESAKRVAESLAPKKTKHTPHPDEYRDVNSHISAFLDWSLRDVIARFGTDTAFVDYLKATKSIEDIHEKRLKNAEVEKKLVSRDLVLRGIIDPVDSVHIKLLSDGARAITAEVLELRAAGKSPEKIVAAVSKKLTTFIRPIKGKMKRALKDMEK